MGGREGGMIVKASLITCPVGVRKNQAGLGALPGPPGEAKNMPLLFRTLARILASLPSHLKCSGESWMVTVGW